MNLRSVRLYPYDYTRDLILENISIQMFRKQLLYPTELRDPSAPVIFSLAERCTNYSASVPAFSSHFPHFPESVSGKHRESQNLNSFKFTAQNATSRGTNMAKRFTDTGIWDKAWFRLLSPRMKEAWRYLCEKCNQAGVWDIDMESMAFHVGEHVEVTELSAMFGERIEFVGNNKIFLPGFIEFQYGCDVSGLNPKNNAHLSVIRILEKVKPLKKEIEPLMRGSLGALDKDKDKDKDLDKEKEGQPLKPNPDAAFKFDLNSLINKHTKHEGRNQARKALQALVKDHETFLRIERAIESYDKHCNDNNVEYKWRKTLAGFIEDGDWLRYETSEVAKQGVTL